MSLQFFLFRATSLNQTKPIIKNEIKCLAYTTRYYSIENKENVNRFKKRADQQPLIRQKVNVKKPKFVPLRNEDRRNGILANRKPDDLDDAKPNSFSNQLNSIYRLSIGNKMPEIYYFTQDGMNINDFQLIYLNDKQKIVKFFVWTLIFLSPFLVIFILYHFYFNPIYSADYDLKEGFDLDTSVTPNQSLAFIAIIILYATVASLHLKHLVTRIYFNKNTKQFVLFLNKIPFFSFYRNKREIEIGQVKRSDMSKHAIIKLFQTGTRLQNGQRLVIRKNCFISPYYHNLFFGETKMK